MTPPAASALAGGVQPLSAAAMIQGGASALTRVVYLLRNLPDTVPGTISRAKILGQEAQEGFRFLRSNGNRFAIMKTV